VNRRRLVAAVVLALVGVAGIVVGLVATRGDGSGGGAGGSGVLAAVLSAATPARAPFTGLTEVRLEAGSRCLQVVVADTEAERV